jgi:DNA-binding transcriptional regulator YdaS (Cro superfamily)
MNPYNLLILHFGSAIEVAKVLQLHRTTVSRWKKNLIPRKRVRQLEIATNRKLTRQMLRPDLIEKNNQN